MSKKNSSGPMCRHRQWLRRAILAMCLSTGTTYACSPGFPDIYLRFPKHSHMLTADAALKLGTWLAEQRVNYPNYDYFLVDAYRVGGEAGGVSLISARAETVRRFFLDRGFNPERIESSARKSLLDDPAKPEVARAVNVSIVAACPHACCSMETHKVEFTGLPMPTDSGMAAAGGEAR